MGVQATGLGIRENAMQLATLKDGGLAAIQGPAGREDFSLKVKVEVF